MVRDFFHAPERAVVSRPSPFVTSSSFTHATSEDSATRRRDLQMSRGRPFFASFFSSSSIARGASLGTHCHLVVARVEHSVEVLQFLERHSPCVQQNATQKRSRRSLFIDLSSGGTKFVGVTQRRFAIVVLVQVVELFDQRLLFRVVSLFPSLHLWRECEFKAGDRVTG